MSDHKFTDDDVIKALECSVEHNERKNASCDGCPLEKVFPYCNRECSEDTLDVMYLALINRQKAEIEKLNDLYVAGLESLRLASEANKDMQAEIERLTTERDEARRDCAVAEHNHQLAVAEREANVRGFAETLQKIAAEQASRVVEAMDEIKVVAIKEFAQRLKSDLGRIPQYHFTRSEVEWSINALEKEMTEGTK